MHFGKLSVTSDVRLLAAQDFRVTLPILSGSLRPHIASWPCGLSDWWLTLFAVRQYLLNSLCIKKPTPASSPPGASLQEPNCSRVLCVSARKFCSKMVEKEMPRNSPGSNAVPPGRNQPSRNSAQSACAPQKSRSSGSRETSGRHNAIRAQCKRAQKPMQCPGMLATITICTQTNKLQSDTMWASRAAELHGEWLTTRGHGLLRRQF